MSQLNVADLRRRAEQMKGAASAIPADDVLALCSLAAQLKAALEHSLHRNHKPNSGACSACERIDAALSAAKECGL